MNISSRTRSSSRSKMKQQNEASVSLLLNLPDEVHHEISLRVPAESIPSLRCVCKVFNNLLSKPSFIKNHLINQSRTRNPKILFFRLSKDKDPVVYTIPIDYASISSASECKGAVLMNYPFQFNEFYFHEFLGSCNGLVCSKISASNERGFVVRSEYFSILNPLTREFKEFTMPLERKNLFPSVRCGFGYDGNIDDYKLVMISDYECAGCLKIDVYQVKSDSWSSVQGTVDYLFPSNLGCHSVYLNGAIHWLGTTTAQEASSKVIISFDVSNETIVDMPLPEHIPPVNYRDRMFANIGVWGDCIGVALTWRRIRVEIWVMQEYGVKESWSKRFTITEQPLTTYPHWKLLWCYDNREILIDNYGEQLALYDPTTKRVRSVVVSDVMDGWRETYVESIVSLGSGTYLEKQVTDRKLKKKQLR